MKVLLLSITVISSLLMVVVILLQQGKGAGLGSAFGGGARGGLYESGGGQATALSRITAILAAIFLASSLALSLYIGRDAGVLEELRETESVVESIPADSEESSADASDGEDQTTTDDSEPDSTDTTNTDSVDNVDNESDKAAEIPE